MGKVDWPIVSYSLRIALFWHQNNKSLIQQIQPLLVLLEKLCTTFMRSSFITSQQAEKNNPMKPSCLV
jgi:hypothetical protein